MPLNKLIQDFTYWLAETANILLEKSNAHNRPIKNNDVYIAIKGKKRRERSHGASMCHHQSTDHRYKRREDALTITVFGLAMAILFVGIGVITRIGPLASFSVSLVFVLLSALLAHLAVLNAREIRSIKRYRR